MKKEVYLDYDNLQIIIENENVMQFNNVEEMIREVRNNYNVYKDYILYELVSNENGKTTYEKTCIDCI